MRDFVLTIDDEDKVEDLENEKGTELNPEFSFGDEAPVIEGWDFGGEKSENDQDALDEIIKRHGGLKEAEDEGKDADAAPEAADDPGSEASHESESESESEPAQEEPKTTVENDQSGFFADNNEETKASFSDMSLSRPIKKGISALGYTTPTPIQSAVIPVALLGKDVVAGAVTGSGKTAAFMIPTLERLVYRSQRSAATRVVVLTPTRELAMQVHDVGSKLGKYVSNLRFGLAVGGLNLRTQEQELKTRPDIVIATPGRFIDHVRNSPSFSVDTVEILIIDEADRMLEEGFEAEITEILRLIPTKRQTLLFSATMNSNIKDLVRLSLKKPVRLMVNPPKQAASGLVQEFVRIRKHEESRPAILASLLRKLGNKQRVIVFISQKKIAHRLRVVLGLLGLKVGELHGSLSQEQRLSNVTAFKKLDVPVLLCTDLASRGLDIPKIEVVINYQLPSTYDVYLHRVGRTARAGRTGTSISLVGDGTTERQIVRSAINSANENTSAQKQKILGRDIDWEEIANITKEIESNQETVDEILQEERATKQIELAERDLHKAKNLLDHRDEIHSRPKRTWFEKEKPEKTVKKPKTNHAKKKADAGKQSWAYKKTKDDRKIGLQRGAARAIMKSGTKPLKEKAKKSRD